MVTTPNGIDQEAEVIISAERQGTHRRVMAMLSSLGSRAVSAAKIGIPAGLLACAPAACAQEAKVTPVSADVDDNGKVILAANNTADDDWDFGFGEELEAEKAETAAEKAETAEAKARTAAEREETAALENIKANLEEATEETGS